ncbi:MAG: type II toxin-antitoxin system VapC family toxin [Acidobacteria bacterium]|nr:type II toxin-antitoxin system VapC family toxin [Acidobacteriota bacterium]
MSYLLDTNVVSEWAKPQPNPAVIVWLDGVDEDCVFLSVITLTELRYGLECLPAGKKKSRLQHWVEHDLAVRFEGRVLNVDPPVARACGELLARQKALGRPLGVMDAYLAATAGIHGLTLVTRNDSDFTGVIQCLNPWR